MSNDQYAALAELAGGFVHEIKNHLSTLGLNLQLLAEDLQDPQTQTLPAGYSSARVQRALQELADQLDETANLTGQIETRELGPRGDINAQTVLDALDDQAVIDKIASKLSGTVRDTIISTLKAQLQP